MRRIMLALLAMAVTGATSAMTLSSADLQAESAIPPAHVYPRCGGQNISPQLSWSGAPAQTQSFVLTMIDTSVQPAQWSHWVVVDIPANVTSLGRGAKSMPAKAIQVPSNFGDPYYDGPCPPDGSGKHRYEITVWALGTPKFSAPADMKATDLKEALSKVALGQATLAAFVTR